MSWDSYVSAWSGTHDGYDPRQAGPALRGWLRTAYRLGALLARRGVRPALMQMISVLCAIMVPAVAALGGQWPVLAALFLLVGIAAQTVTDTLAVLLARTTRLGSFYRTMVDRLSELCWLAALATCGVRAGLLIACGALVWLHEYMRARAGAVGLRPAGSTTIGDRPTRAWLTLLSLLLAAAANRVSPDLAAGVVTMMMVGWLSLAVIGLGQLLGIVRKVLA